MGEEPSAPSEIRAAPFTLGQGRFVLISYDLLPPAVAELLTPAEREVLLASLEGLRPREVAAQRGTRLRTVHNQLARIHRKLGVSSQGELLARYGAAPTGA